MVRIGISGFGRIGRLALRRILTLPDAEVVAINNRTVGEIMAHLLKYDSVHGTMKEDVAWEDGFLVIDGKKIPVISETDITKIPWGKYGADIVLECTGKFKDSKEAQAHIDNGAKKVIISAPGKNEDITIVMGVNEDKYDPAKHHIISNASCTTNCLAPFTKVLLEKFGIESGLMTTVHSIIPTTTGAAKAVALVLPELKGKLNGFALRVPTPDVSLTDLTVNLAKDATVEEINAALKEAAEGELKGILGYTDLPLVSSDFIGCEVSSVIDGQSTMMIGKRLAKVVAWYDNEWGYSCRLVDLALYVGKKGL